MTRHEFHPLHYYNSIGSHTPALHVAPGDSVSTTTVDGRGFDSEDNQITPPGNPMTGPFHVAGAEPGDTLVVHLDKVTPNRRRGWSFKMVWPTAVEPEYVRQLPWPDDNDRLATWDVDVRTGTVELVHPRDTNLGGLTLPLSPMIGCFGVAPVRSQAISTRTAGEHGGNMDYQGFGEGVTIYLPVSADGALFHLGDGHARQGHGEIMGTGVEISLDVEFTVDLMKRKSIRWPRGENADYIFTVGNARPLDQATQHATTEMLRWLQEEYALDPTAAHLLLGHCVEYELANMYNPAFTIVCKMPKRYLNRLESGRWKT